MNLPRISKRLSSAASLVREGVRIADIGTDHAYLPIYLYLSGKVSGGVVSDINQGPVDRARANLFDYGCEDAFVAQRADGLDGVLAHGVEDIFILGMGGELIASIIENEPALRDSRYSLVLQPMTHSEILRKYLGKVGFEIDCELIVEEDKIYQIMRARYTGRVSEYSLLELNFGARNLEKPTPELFALMKRTRAVYGERVKGKALSGVDTSQENEMIEKIDKFLSKYLGE